MAKIVDLGTAGKDSPDVPPFKFNKESKPATVIRSANKRLEDAKDLPDILPMFGNLIGKGHLIFLFADTKTGKTILAVQYADCASRGISCLGLENQCGPQRVLYYDFELTDKQFEKRYKHYMFSDNLHFATINREDNSAAFSIDQIEKDVLSTKAEVIVIDNISALSIQNLAEAEAANKLMKELDRLKKRYGLTILVLAHTPKIAAYQPISMNHLAGAKQLQNFCDGMFAIGKSVQGKGIRYIKNIINRDFEPDEEVIDCQIMEDERGVLCYGACGYSMEEDHLEKKEKGNISAKSELKMRAMDLKAEGKSLREIADILNVGKSTIERFLKDVPEQSNTSSKDLSVPEVSHCPTVPELGHLGQSKDPYLQLAFKILSGYVDRGKQALIKAIMFSWECGEIEAIEHFTRLIESGYVISLGQDSYILKE